MKTETLKKIRETSSTNEKMFIAINEFDEDTHKFMEECFNEEIYGISETNISKAIGYDEFIHGKFEDLGDFLEKNPKYGTRVVSNITICDFIKEIKNLSGNDQIARLKELIEKRISNEDAPWYIRILLKNPRIGMSLTNYNKVREKCNIPRIEKHFVKLATLLEPEQFETLPYPIYSEVKYDGERACIYYENGSIKIMSRNGNDISSQYPEIIKKIKESFEKTGISKIFLDGEIISKSFNDLQKRMNRLEKNINTDYDLEFICFDILNVDNISLIDTKQIDRRIILEKLFEKNDLKIKISESIFCHNIQELNDFYYKCINRGEEGIIVKELDALWATEENDRKKWYKVKPVYTSDLKVFKYEYGKGKNKDFITVLYVEDKNGVIRSKVSGMTDEMKKFITKMKDDIIGKIVEVKYNKVTDTNSLRHPRFIRIRFDKNEVDEIKKW
jgi:ATP-dependent DNA ligase